ncbi:unnamed protein product [Penicillium manginii]
MESDLVNDSKLPVRFSANNTVTHHVIFESSTRTGQQVRRQRIEESWERVKHLGRGGFGSVWLERCSRVNSQPKTRAVKAIKKSSASSQGIDLKRELQTIAKFSHWKYEGLFVKSFGWYEDDSLTYIAMEYFELGDLQKCILQPLPERETQQITYQLLEGLEKLHLDGYAHRDLKPENIFVIQKSPDWWVKIGDFGISKRVNEGNTALRSLFGSSGYMAPEMLEDTRHTRNFQYDEKVDMWSLGILVHYMITKTLPFDTDSKWKEYMKSSQFPSTKLATFKVSEECHNFITKALLTRKAANRMSSSNALQHQWLRDFNTANSNEQKIVSHENYKLATEKVDEKNIDMASEVASLSLRSTDASARWSAQTETERSISVPQKAQERATQEQTRAPAVGEGLAHFNTNQWTESSSSVFENAPEERTESVRRFEEEDAEDADWEGEGPRHWVYKKDLNRPKRNKAPKLPAPSGKHIAHSHRGDPAQNDAEIFSLHEAGRAACAEKRFEDAEKNFRQVLRIREVLLGPDHEDTINVTHWLGVTTFHLIGEIEEAESLLRRALRGREKLHGNRHEDTFNTVFWLGRCLHIKKKYKEAEGLFQRALQGREKLHGDGHTKTLDAAHWLGKSLHLNKKYKEAEGLFQRALQGREKLHGDGHTKTHDAAYWLGKSLYLNEKYKEAEGLFQRALQGREKLHGDGHTKTLDAVYWLGKSLHSNGKYKKAEGLFRRVLQGREKVYGPRDEETLDTAQWLGRSCLDQGKYKEAEELFRRVLQGREKVYGPRDEETLDTAEWLGKVLYLQRNYKDAKQLFERCEQGFEKLLGPDHEDTKKARGLVGKATNKILLKNTSK